MDRSKIFLAGIAGLILIIVCCLLLKTTHIENDLLSRAQSALPEDFVSASDISVDGRDVTVSGYVSSNQEKEETENALAGVVGVRTVINMLEVSAPAAVILEKDIVKTHVQDFLDEFSKIQAVEFETGNSTILPKSKEKLKNLAAFINKNPDIKIKIEGHTDSTGDKDLNIKLSSNRAKAVLDWLVQNNVKQERLSAIGYGDSKPVADNSTSVGRSKNRRVEFRIQEDL